MLSKELNELEVNELVNRKVYDALPVMVEYELTAYGKMLKPLSESCTNGDRSTVKESQVI